MESFSHQGAIREHTAGHGYWYEVARGKEPVCDGQSQAGQFPSRERKDVAS